MAQNVEIKARVVDPVAFREAVAKLTSSPGQIIHQTDTFFTVPQGRLKLRDFGDGHGELIRYQRPNASGPKISDYSISRTEDPDGLGKLLAAALPVLGVVIKERTLFLAGRTRIHFDDVQGLGWFMELEVVLADGDSPEEGETEAHRLMNALGINQDDLVQGAYLDLLVRKSEA